MRTCVTCGDISCQNILDNMFQTFGDRTIVSIIAAINFHKDGTGVRTENRSGKLYPSLRGAEGCCLLSVKLHSISADTLRLATMKVGSKLPTITCLVARKLKNFLNLGDLEINMNSCGLCITRENFVKGRVRFLKSLIW